MDAPSEKNKGETEIYTQLAKIRVAAIFCLVGFGGQK